MGTQLKSNPEENTKQETDPKGPEKPPLLERQGVISDTTDGTLEMPEIPAAGALHKKYQDRLETLPADIGKDDLEKLKKSSIEEIRYNTALLKARETGDIQKLKDETLRRLKAYTLPIPGENAGLKQYSKDWYILNYSTVGGKLHERSIGLGDILLDPDIRTILVLKTDGTQITAHRGIVPEGKKHAGRVGFLDENDNYVATFDRDKFRILDNVETNPEEKDVSAKYLEEVKKEAEARLQHREIFKEEERRRSWEVPEILNKEDIEEYSSRTDAIEKMYGMDPKKDDEVSDIPKTQRVDKLPPKEDGIVRMVVFGDTNGGKDTTGQKYLQELQSRIAEWQTDFVLGVGDHMAATTNTLPETYNKLQKHALEELRQFGDIPQAYANGNHDLDLQKQGPGFEALYTERLKAFDYHEGNGCYSYKLGASRFVVFNTGTSTVTEDQKKFFKEEVLASEGAVYLVSHVPPIQHAYGEGLRGKGDESTVSAYQELIEFAQENLEKKGKQFYIIGGHDHFHAAIGRFLNPGGMGSAYDGLPGKLTSVPSCAVVDMDEATGQIKAVYFMDARSGFSTTIPEFQRELAFNEKEDLFKKVDTLYPPVTVSEDRSVVSQMKNPLNAKQRANAEIIEKMFKEAGLSNSVIAAAFVNVWAESGFQNIPSHNRAEGSYGLFQLNIAHGAGHGMTPEQCLDPEINTRTILDREVLTHRGDALREAAEKGASVSRLAAIFSRDIERPGDVEKGMRERAQLAVKMFGLAS